MILHLFSIFLLVAACVIVHAIGMLVGTKWFMGEWRGMEHHFKPFYAFWLLVRIVFGLLVLLLVQLFIWAAFYQFQGCFDSFETAAYYSAASYSTVGYGDVVPPPAWRMFGAIEAVTGVLMFGWSTGMLFGLAARVQAHFFKPDHGHPPPDRH